MKKCLTILMALAILPSSAFAALSVGQAAPDFTLEGHDSEKHSLSDYKGKIIVLEWTNPACPFVRKHYDRSLAMPELQKKYAEEGVIWLSINSSGKGKQGYLRDVSEAKGIVSEKGAHPRAYLLDPEGKVGKLYSARTTPHIFIIDKEGKIAYQGAIDSVESANPDDLKGATNYLDVALTQLLDGETVTTPVTQPYGCSVKYAD